MPLSFAIGGSRVVRLEALPAACAALREAGARIVFTNGCFDILHRGHAEYLAAARALGDALVVAVNTDRSVRGLKGEGRPIVPEDDRAALVASLRAVDLVVLFDEPTPYNVVAAVRPDVLVKGGDYDPDATEGPRAIVGADIVRASGGSVATIPLVEGRSTTDVVARVLEAYGRS